MKKIVFDFKFILSAYLLFFLIMLFTVILIPKGGEVLWLNQFKNSYLSFFFRQITHLGEWFLIALLAGYLLWKNKKKFNYLALGFFIQLILSQALKKLFNMPRPLSFFGERQLQIIENTPRLYHYSFPSGHTTTAFFLAFFMILFFRFNKKYSIVVFLLAVLVGISRIYLLAHFKEDVLFGSFLGLISAMVAYFYYNKSIRLESSTDE